MKSLSITTTFLAALTLIVGAGCRGQVSESPPIHLNPNMDSQPRYDGLGESAFFADHRVARTPPKGTVAQGHLEDDDALHRGLDENGQILTYIPIEVSAELIDRGENQYNIFCAPCHSGVGDGKGLVAVRGKLMVPDFHDKGRMGAVSDGKIFSAIDKGFSTMPSYRFQIPKAEDRWAVVAYIRTLQRSRDVALTELPPAQRAKLQ